MNALLQVDRGALNPSPARLHADAGRPRRASLASVDDSATDYVDRCLVNAATFFGAQLLEAPDERRLTFALQNQAAEKSFVDFHEYLCRLAFETRRPPPFDPGRLRARLAWLPDAEHQVEAFVAMLQVAEPASYAVVERIGTLREPTGIQGATLHALLEQTTTPGAYRRPVRAGLQSNAAQLALLEAELRRNRDVLVEPWKLRLLVQHAADGLRRHLPLLAGMAGGAISESIVPRHERVDWNSLVDQWETQLARVSELYMAHRESGQVVYFPFGGPPDL